MHCTRLKAHDVIEGRKYVHNLPRCKSTKYMFAPVLRLVFLPHKFISFPISLRGESNGCPPPYICCVAVTVWRERVASCHPDGKRPWLYSMAGTPSPFFVWFARSGGIVSSRWEASMAIQHGRHSLPLFCLVC